jgi:caffeoyl-CoA O-methyltransferase
MVASGEAGFDFAFIDADKGNYDNYYERSLKLVRPGGLIAFDNMLWSGAVADPDIKDPDTSALRALNAKIHADDRVDMALATVGDGVMLARVR